MGYYMDEFFRVDYPYYKNRINDILKLEKNRIEQAKKNRTLIELKNENS